MNDLAKELENMDDETLAQLAEGADEAPKDTMKNAKQKTMDEGSSDDDNEKIGDNVDHGHLFDESKGGAKVRRGDEGFDEEMGGESQNIEAFTKVACEDMDTDDNDEELEEDGNQPAPPGYYPCQLTVPSPVPRSANAGVRETTKTSAKNMDRGTEDGKTNDDDDKSFEDPHPSPVKSSCNNNKKIIDSGIFRPSPVRGLGNIQKESNNGCSEELSPDSSTADQSTELCEGLRTQPTLLRSQPTPQLRPMQRAPKRGSNTKVSIMGTIFENRKKGQKKSGGIYMPSYARK